MKQQTYLASEIRILTRGKQRRIVGSIPYNSQSRDLNGFVEVLKPGCFAESLKRSDPPIVAFWNHNADQILGSTANRTLMLKDTPTALRFEILPPETSYSQDAISLISSGTVSGCSFSFNVRREKWNKELREVILADLFEVSPCTRPAYPKTSVDVRSRAKTNQEGVNTMTTSELLEEKGRIVKEMRDINDKYQPGQAYSAEHEESYRRMERRLDEINQLLRRERLEREQIASESGASVLRGVVGNADTDYDSRDRLNEARNLLPGARNWNNAEVRIFSPGTYKPLTTGIVQEERDSRVFSKLLLGNLASLTDQEKAIVNSWSSMRALQADLDVAGGFVVSPEQLASRIVDELMDEVYVRRFATVLILNNAASLGVPTLDSDPSDPTWTSEIKTGGTPDSEMDFAKRELRPHPLARLIKISEKLVRLAATDIIAYVSKRLAYVFATVEESAFLVGTGVAQPLGLLTASDGGITTARDTTTSATGAVRADDLIDCLYSLKPQYRRNARWLTSRDMLKQVRKLKDGEGNYLWRPGISSNQPDTILDKPFSESEYFPSYASGNYCAIIGDLSFYYVVDELQMQVKVLNELYAETAQIGVIGRKTTDAMPVVESAFQRLKLG